jgi:predicted metal-dependent peptidase
MPPRPRADPSPASDLSQAEFLLSRSIVDLVRREPFFGHVLGGLPRHFTSSIETMAVGLRGDSIQLVVNPSFIMNAVRRAHERTGVLKHEVLHVVLKHLLRIGDSDPHLWNIAADLVVNQYVAPFSLPAGALSLEDFPDLGLEAGETAEHYYAALARASRSRRRHPRSFDRINQLRDRGFPSDHSLWAGAPGGELDGHPCGAAVPQRIRRAMEQVVEDQVLRAVERTRTAGPPGSMPAWLERLVAEMLERRRPKVDWRRVLRAFAASARRSALVTTVQRESRRFESLEGLPPPPGLKLRRTQDLAVAIDTSGSISDETLAKFFGEVDGIHRQGARIQVVECDAEVDRTYEYRGRRPTSASGGGGTSFEPVMQWLRDQPRRLDACIYLTDGEAEAPQTRPPCRLLWIVQGDGGGDHLRFGRQIRID